MSKFLDFAAKKYYEGDPIISDEEFDILAEREGYKNVGSKDGDIPHSRRMWSLAKYYAIDEMPYLDNPVTTPKLDGAAIAIYYKWGALYQALTRGDGVTGKDITDNIACMEIPLTLPLNLEIQITGEVVAPSVISNARNYAAGALGLKDCEEFSSRDLTFIAYGVTPYNADSWTKDLKVLREWGFNTVDEQDWNQFPKDGLVIREDNYTLFEQRGFTSRHPKGAYAFKQQALGVVTKLLDVVWQVGKSGIVSPVAILEPVEIGGATVSRATLHNPKYIEDLGLELGCDVEVIRSGEIIPRVVRRV